jgi:phage repressor protein C with HTH and peptisase S24 domain
MLEDVISRINRRLKVVGKSESAAAREAGLSPDAIRNMRRALAAGRRDAGISTRTINALAPVLRTSSAWLLEGIGAEDGPGAAATVEARLISWVSAGHLAQSDQPVAETELDYAPAVLASDLDPNGDWIALRVDGDSMNRISPHDSIIFVNRKDKRLVPNACYVIGDGHGGATYKRYRPPNSWEPVSTNPEHQPLMLQPGVEPDIIGRVRKTVLAM